MLGGIQPVHPPLLAGAHHLEDFIVGPRVTIHDSDTGEAFTFQLECDMIQLPILNPS
ncbi:hypothetical protein D3C76_656560 [compost metagenome]